MQPLKQGKTKDVFLIEEDDRIRYVGKYAMEFKNTVTGYIGPDGKPVIDSGYDDVVDTVEGKGLLDRRMNSYFFSLLKDAGIPTHFIEDLDDTRMIVEPATLFCVENEAKEFEGSANLENLEVVWRGGPKGEGGYYGSLWRRYPCKMPCSSLGETRIEIYSKGKTDINMRDEILEALGIMKQEDIDEVKSLTKKVAHILYQDFAKRGLHLIDGKIEVGRKKSDGKIMVIDEISSSVLRACNGFTPDENGNCTIYKECILTGYKPKTSSVEVRDFGIKMQITGEPETTIKAKKILTAEEIDKAFGFKHD